MPATTNPMITDPTGRVVPQYYDPGTDTFIAISGNSNGAATSVERLALAADVNAAIGAQAGLRLIGFACKESAAVAAVATFSIKRGATVAAGTLMVPVELKADESTRGWFGPDGLDASAGISIGWVAGTVDLALFYKVAA